MDGVDLVRLASGWGYMDGVESPITTNLRVRIVPYATIAVWQIDGD